MLLKISVVLEPLEHLLKRGALCLLDGDIRIVANNGKS